MSATPPPLPTAHPDDDPRRPNSAREGVDDDWGDDAASPDEAGELDDPGREYDEPPPAATDLGDLAAAVQATGERDIVRRPAGFTARAGAAAADLLIAFLMMFVVLGVSVALNATLPESLAGPLTVLIAIGAVLFYSLTEVIGEATPGKSVNGLSIARREGLPASLGRRIGRWAFKHSLWLFWVATLLLHSFLRLLDLDITEGPMGTALGLAGLGFFCIAPINCLMILLPARLALHDIVSDTAVFRDEDLAKRKRYTGHGFQALLARRPESESDLPGHPS